MANSDLIILSKSATFNNAVQSMIKRTCIIDFGIVKKVVAKGVVQVAVSVSESEADIKIINCTLITPFATALMIDIIPEEGDKVLVFYPRTYDSKMFSKDNDDIIVNESATGYTPFAGLAMLCNQFRTNDYENYIRAEDGDITIKQNDTEIDIKKDNSITVDTSKAKIGIDKDGNISIDAENGKISLKNTAGGSLYSLLNGMLQTLNSTLATQGSPASHTVVPGQFASQIQSLNNLMQ